MTTRAAVLLTAITLALIVMSGLTVLLWNSHDRLTATLDAWKSCPMPTAGAVLVVEADWEGKAADEHFRCRLLRKAPPRPNPQRSYF